MYFCVLSALSPYGGGPTSLTYDESDDIAELALQLAEEVAPTLEGKLSFADIQILLQDTLRLLSDDQRWLLDFTGRNTYDWQEDDFCYTGLVIGPQGSSPKIQVRRVERYSYDYRKWEILVVQCDDGEVRISEPTRYGGKSASFFCWERPYLYFKTWLRFSSPSISDLDDTAFAEKLFLLVDSDHDNCLHRRTVSNLLPCISYGVIKNTEEDGEEELFRTMRVGSKAVADTIAAGKQGCDLWPALAADFGVWMVTRPDVWPPPPARLDSTAVPLQSRSETIFETLPRELLLQILLLLPLHDLFSLQLLSHSFRALISLLLDEVLWHHVHRGNFRWVLPVAEVKGEVKRANSAAIKWCRSTSLAAFRDRALDSILSSRDFPFSSFLRECLQNSDSMRNRQRLWRISQQFTLLWENRFV